MHISHTLHTCMPRPSARVCFARQKGWSKLFPHFHRIRIAMGSSNDCRMGPYGPRFCGWFKPSQLTELVSWSGWPVVSAMLPSPSPRWVISEKIPTYLELQWKIPTDLVTMGELSIYDLCWLCVGFLSHGGTPIAGWLISWQIPIYIGWFRGSPISGNLHIQSYNWTR